MSGESNGARLFRRVDQAEGRIDATISDLRGLRLHIDDKFAEVDERFDLAEKASERRHTETKTQLELLSRQLVSAFSQIGQARANATEARNKASGAHRLGQEAIRRVSQVEADDVEWAAKMAVAQADGDEEAKAFRRKLVMKLAGGGGVSVALALIAAISQCSGG